MTWTRLSDTFTDRPDILLLTDAAFRTHVNALVWCNRQLTDGALAAAALRLVAVSSEAVDELIDAGLWESTDAGYRLDWSDQESSERVKARRDAGARRQADFRQRKELHAVGDHSKCRPDHCTIVRAAAVEGAAHTVTDTVSNAVTDAVSNNTPSRPVPTRPLQGQGQGRGTATPAATAATVPRDREHTHRWVADGTCMISGCVERRPGPGFHPIEASA